MKSTCAAEIWADSKVKAEGLLVFQRAHLRRDNIEFLLSLLIHRNRDTEIFRPQVEQLVEKIEAERDFCQLDKSNGSTVAVSLPEASRCSEPVFVCSSCRLVIIVASNFTCRAVIIHRLFAEIIPSGDVCCIISNMIFATSHWHSATPKAAAETEVFVPLAITRAARSLSKV
ncbi:hypothetical protein AB1N83_001400 [Pleurotus pulmonarius]